MLRALYEYALRHGLTIPDGFVRKTVSAYIWFSSAAKDFVEIRLGDEEPIPCPDIGSLANGTEKSNVIVEKSSVVVPDTDSTKSRFFREALRSLGQTDDDARLCAERLDDPAILERIRARLAESRIKGSMRVSFMVDDRRLPDSPYLAGWWQTYRRGLLPSSDGERVPCLITGELTDPVVTAPKITGLRRVGGHASGDALICFDKPAFCSYGLKQAANAPVSESAMNAVKAALDDLLASAPKPLCGMMFVHWYDRDLQPQDDPIFDDNFIGSWDDDPEETDGEAENGSMAEPDGEAEAMARHAADRLVGSVRTGESVIPLDTGYHILLLSGVGGRVMVRRYERGHYETLQRNLARWDRDLALTDPAGSGLCRPIKLAGRLIRLLKYQKNDQKVFRRLNEELSGIAPAVLTAILNGGKLPDAAAIRALAHIRSRMMASDDPEQSGRTTDDNLDGRACQWLKVWLIRHREEGDDMLKETYNAEHPEAAYHCGALMAVYAAIQRDAMPDVNVTVVQRYYASCIQSPALVLGRLSQLCVHHLEKLPYYSMAGYYRELLETVNSSIGNRIPTTLDLEKQSYFALGYYQMAARIRRETKERIEAAKRNAKEA